MPIIDKKKTLEEQINDESIKACEIDVSLITAYNGFYNRVVKRCIDFVLALILLIVISPLFLFVSLAIIIEDGMPVFYKAQRGGYKSKTFRIIKFRSMVKNADKIGGGTTQLHDNRITRVGAIIRKIKVDEVSNLINVLKGEMSFIGPRPELLTYTEQYSGAEKLILEVRPGMTDYSSIEFINLDELVGEENADEAYEKYVLPTKNKLRIKYVADVSFATDVKLFALTIFKVLEKAFTFSFLKKHR